MIIINFSHPLTAEHLAQIETLSGHAGPPGRRGMTRDNAAGLLSAIPAPFATLKKTRPADRGPGGGAGNF